MRAFIGMGLLGANFVKAMLKKGMVVQVWNRTGAKAKVLEAEGARSFDLVADAVRGADIVHITLKDDASVDEVLAQASAGLKPGAILIDHTTTSAEGAVARTQAWKAKGFIYLHAPVFMGPVNALESTGTMLVSGDQDIIHKVEPLIAPLTGKVLNFGKEEGKAAAMKLIGNLFLVAFTAGIADTLMLAKAMHVSVNDISNLFDTWNPAAMLPSRLKRMTSGSYDKPSWELNMARKDTQLFLNAAAAGHKELTVIPAVAKLMDKWIAKGHGGDDWVVIGKDAL